MENKMNKSESIKELATALSKAQGELENASKTSANPFFKSKYADLAEIINTSKDVLAANGLSVIQMPGGDASAGIVSVETMLCHSSGEWVSNIAIAPLNEKISNGKSAPPDAQSVGSAITYLRRYSLAAFLGIAQEDDDANSASGKQAPAQEPIRPHKKPEAPKLDLQSAVNDIMAMGNEEELKECFASYWKIASEKDKVELKKAYDFVKKEIEAMASV